MDQKTLNYLFKNNLLEVATENKRDYTEEEKKYIDSRRVKDYNSLPECVKEVVDDLANNYEDIEEIYAVGSLVNGTYMYEYDEYLNKIRMECKIKKDGKISDIDLYIPNYNTTLLPNKASNGLNIEYLINTYQHLRDAVIVYKRTIEDVTDNKQKRLK